MLKKLKAADEADTHLVFGWIRSVEQLMKFDNIPMAIFYLCWVYYHVGEYFYNARKDHFEISNNKSNIRCINSICYDDHTIFMKYRVNSMSNKIIKWTFKINEYTGRNSDEMYFGIMSVSLLEIKLSKSLKHDVTAKYRPNYLLTNGGQLYHNSQLKKNGRSLFHPFGRGAKLSFTLNLPASKFILQIDEKPGIVLFNDIKRESNINYRFFMQLEGKNDSVTLLDFIVS